MRQLLAAAVLVVPLAGWAQAGDTTPAANCRPDPLAGRALYLRGSFNGWTAGEDRRFTWACQRWELVTRLSGEQVFKIADEAWSEDADFGSRDGVRLERRGAEIQRRFDGLQRFTVTPGGAAPTLHIEACPAAAPLGETTLFLRGTLNNWGALDEHAFQYSCDAYYLNLKASGRHEFKIADAGWRDTTTFGRDGGNFEQVFDGEHTLQLAFDGGRPRLAVGPRTFADPRAPAVTDAVALSLRFDSRAAAHKSPFGAAPAGTPFNFAVTTRPGVAGLSLVVESRRFEGNQEVLAYSEVARVPMTKSLVGEHERWTASHRFDAVGVYGYWFEAQIGGRRYVLQNNADAVYWTREKGSGGAGAVADGPPVASSIRRYRQTIFDPGFQVPAWAPDTVYYSIFPERFRNGDPRNDPRPGGGRVQDRFHAGTVERHANWNGRPFRPGTGDGSDGQYNNDFFGGDIAGIVEKLDNIRDLGANAIYLTPVFRAASNHKYDTADYKRIDPAFGSDADFTRLTQEAKKRGIRVIIDTSLNHTGADSVYFDRYGTHGSGGAFEGGRVQPGSRYASWYRFDPSKPTPEQQYKGWGGPDLPELDKSSPALRDFFYRSPDAVMKHWLDRGAAGWRMDVVPWVPDDFWREWRAAIKAHRPDALTVAETWFDASKYFLGDMFDSTMNYIFRNAVLDYAAGGKAELMVANLEHLREAYPPQALYALMNLLSSHDQARALHQLGGHDGAKDAAALARAKQRLKLAVLFQMSYPGAPSVYYGDEVGVTGGDDPYNRGTYPWADRGGRPDMALRAEFRKLIALRQAHAVLRRGSLEAPLHTDAQVVVLVRRLGDSWALTATNNADVPREVALELPVGLRAEALRDVLSPRSAGAGAAPALRRQTDGRWVLEVPALYGRVLVTR